jgi:hypothetical protein
LSAGRLVVTALAHPLSRLAHALGDAPALELTRGFRRRTIGTLPFLPLTRTGSLTLLRELPLKALGALRQAFLLACELTQPIPPTLARSRAVRFRTDLALLLGQLARLELHLTERAASLVRHAAAQLPLRLTKPLERARTSLGGARGILSSQVARGATHFA